MKKTLLSVFTAFSMITGVMAQAPDLGFETWVTAAPSSMQDPTGWASFNVLNVVGMPQTVFKETTAPFAGTASAKVVTDVLPSTVMIPNPFKPSENMDTVGILAMGATQFSSPYVRYGKPYAFRPATLSFSCKYTPVAGDTAFVVVYLTKWMGTYRDTIASGKYKTGATTTAYSMQSINLTYDASSTTFSDTQMVFISSSVYDHPGAKKGSAFYIDDLAWSGYVSTEDIAGLSGQVTIYPNPAADRISVKSSVAAASIELIDITGRLVGTYTMNDNKAQIETSGFASGLYIYNILDENKKVINRGKFEIAK